MTRPLKRSFQIRGHRTSISLEDEFWDALQEMAAERDVSLSQLVAEIDTARDATATSLSGAIRLAILGYYREAAAKSGR